MRPRFLCSVAIEELFVMGDTNRGSSSIHSSEFATFNWLIVAHISGNDSGMDSKMMPSGVFTANPPLTPGSTATIGLFDFIRFLVAKDGNVFRCNPDR